MAQYIGTTVITSVVAGTNCSGGGTAGAVTIDVDDAFIKNDADDTTSGALTVTGAAGVTIKDTTASSATEGGNLILASADGAVMGSGHRLGVVEFKGLEGTDPLTLATGARIEAITDAVWSTSENGADLVFYTTDGNASETEQMRCTAATGVSIPKRKMAVSTNVDGNVGSGDIVYFGTGSSVVGKIYHYKSDGSWELADANAAANCDGLLAVAIGTDPDVDGMLIRGMVTLIDIQGTEAVGDVLYLSESATGAADCVAPAGNLDIIRVIGYCLSTDDQVWFDPDKTFVEVTV
jgi:hypothetical protein